MAQIDKYPFALLAVLDWLTEDGAGPRFVTRSSHSNSYFYEARPGEEEKRVIERVYPSGRNSRQDDIAFLKRLGGRDSIDFQKAYRDGLVVALHSLGHSANDKVDGRASYQKMMARYENNPFHYSDVVYRPTEKAFTVMAEKGRDLLAKLRDKRRRDEGEVSRLVLIGQKANLRPVLPKDLLDRFPKGYVVPNPGHEVVRPYAIARVVRETPQRLYLDDIEMAPLAKAEWRYDSVISGYEPNRYVTHDQIMVDDATPEILRKLVEIDAEHLADLERMTIEMAERILPSIQDMAARLVQKDAERADLVREAVDEHRRDAEDRAGPGDPKP